MSRFVDVLIQLLLLFYSKVGKSSFFVFVFVMGLAIVYNSFLQQNNPRGILIEYVYKFSWVRIVQMYMKARYLNIPVLHYLLNCRSRCFYLRRLVLSIQLERIAVKVNSKAILAMQRSAVNTIWICVFEHFLFVIVQPYPTFSIKWIPI